MTTTPTTNKTQTAAHEMGKAHTILLERLGIAEDEWLLMLFDHGYTYAALFCRLFPDRRQQTMEDILLKTKAEGNDPNNWFWMWWKFQWMLDDMNYVNNDVHLSRLSYPQFKSYMLNCEHLEESLLSLFEQYKVI